MTKRHMFFDGFKAHAWLSRVYSRLSPADITTAYEFMTAKSHLSKGEFDFAINRMFIDKGDAKPKRWKEIQELLTCANSSL